MRIDAYYINIYLYIFKHKTSRNTHLFAEYIFVWRQTLKKIMPKQTPSSGGYPAFRSVFKG